MNADIWPVKIVGARRAGAWDALAVAKECATRIRAFYRDTTYGGIPRTYASYTNDEDFIEYIPPATVLPAHTVIDGIPCPFR